jgi:cytochrome c553
MRAAAAGIAALTLWVDCASAQRPSDAIAAGREKFVQCAACHGADGRSTVIPAYPKIGGQSAAYVVNALKAYRDGRRQGTYAAIMAAVAVPLSDAEIANLAAYIESLESPP